MSTTSTAEPRTKAERRGRRAVARIVNVFYRRLRDQSRQIETLQAQVQTLRGRLDELAGELGLVAEHVARVEGQHWSTPRPGLPVADVQTVIDRAYGNALERLGDADDVDDAQRDADRAAYEEFLARRSEVDR